MPEWYNPKEVADTLQSATEKANISQQQREQALQDIYDYRRVSGVVDPEKTKILLQILIKSTPKWQEEYDKLVYYFNNIAYIEVQERAERNARIAEYSYWEWKELKENLQKAWYEVVSESGKNSSWFDGVFIRNSETQDEVFVFKGTEKFKFDGDITADLLVSTWWIAWKQIRDMIKFYEVNPTTMKDISIIWHSLGGYLSQVLAIYQRVKWIKMPSNVYTYNSPWLWSKNIQMLENIFKKWDFAEIEAQANKEWEMYTTEVLNKEIDGIMDEKIQLASLRAWSAQESAFEAVSREHSLQENVELAKKYIQENASDIDLDDEALNKYGKEFDKLDIRLQAVIIVIILKAIWVVAWWVYLAWCLIKWKQEDYRDGEYWNVFNFVWEECPHLVTNTVFTGERIWYQAYIKGSVSHSITEVIMDIEKMTIEEFKEATEHMKWIR